MQRQLTDLEGGSVKMERINYFIHMAREQEKLMVLVNICVGIAL